MGAHELCVRGEALRRVTPRIDGHLDELDITDMRRGNGLLISPVTSKDDWTGFWDDLAVLSRPITRGKTRRAEKRSPL